MDPWNLPTNFNCNFTYHHKIIELFRIVNNYIVHSTSYVPKLDQQYMADACDQAVSYHWREESDVSIELELWDQL